jgi:hypothetical protein
VDSWVFSTESSLSFDEETGLPSSLILGSTEFFTDTTPAGFYLVQTDEDTDTETETFLSSISVADDEVTVKNDDGSISFTLLVKGYGNHVALHLTDIQGINDDHSYMLRLYLKTNAAVSLYTLNDYIATNSRRTNTYLTIEWSYLWGWARPDGTYGSIVLYDGSKEDSELDSILAEIWAVQGTLGYMVYPDGQSSWTQDDVLAWVEKWADKFETISVVSLAPEDEEELYDMTDNWVLPAGANRVYFFSTYWRGEYHLQYLSNESVEADAFPDGKYDLIAYSNYLAEYGAHLQLKSLVPQMGLYDERYFSDTYVEPRLLSWGSGTLVDDIGLDDTTILFQPGSDYIWEQESGYVRIDNEMIQAGTITIDEDTGIWTLSDCERGHAGSSASSHSSGDEVVGVSASYGFFHFADDFGEEDSLAEEILDAYGEFLSEVEVGHLHFDGTLTKEEAPWYLRNYTDYLYSRVDQPVTGSIVGGSIDANFERQFPMAEQAAAASSYWDIRIGPRLAGSSSDEDREHSPSLLDIHFDISDRIMLEARRPNFTAGQSGGRLTTEILENYGLIDEAYELFQNWVELAPVYDDLDAEYVSGFMTKGSGVHYYGEDILVLSKNSSDEFIYTPHRVMGQTSGDDDYITIDQEWGAIPRYQYIAAGDSLELTNPYDAQQPQVLIYVDEDTTTLQDPVITVNSTGTLSVTGDIEPGQYLKYETGDTATVYDENWNIVDTLPATALNFTVNNGDNTLLTEAGSGTDAPDDLKVQFITVDEPYVLKANDYL